MNEKPAESSNHQDKLNLRESSAGTSRNSISQIRKTILEEHGYTILDQIGTGGYASVKVVLNLWNRIILKCSAIFIIILLFKTAYSNREKQIVAIKIIHKYKVPTDYLNKFVPRELNVVRGIDHVNIIRYYRYIETTQR